MPGLLLDHAEIPAIARMREEVDDFDEVLRRMCDSYGPVPDEQAPRGLPGAGVESSAKKFELQT